MNKKILAVMLAVMMLFGACGAMAEAALITVQGTAQILTDPDMVSVTANASVTAGTVGSAQEAMNAIVAAATQKLLALLCLVAAAGITAIHYENAQRRPSVL